MKKSAVILLAILLSGFSIAGAQERILEMGVVIFYR
jgi:hypothetical protein